MDKEERFEELEVECLHESGWMRGSCVDCGMKTDN